MSEIRDKSHALIFPDKRDNSLYKIRKDMIEIKRILKDMKESLIKIEKSMDDKNGRI